MPMSSKPDPLRWQQRRAFLVGITAAAGWLDALAFHLPNVATVAMTATLAQLGALIGWRRREGSPVVARTPAASLMVAPSLAYLIAAIVVATVPQTAAMAVGPVLLLLLSLALDARTTGHVRQGGWAVSRPEPAGGTASLGG
jgi:hypothetical protein